MRSLEFECSAHDYIVQSTLTSFHLPMLPLSRKRLLGQWQPMAPRPLWQRKAATVRCPLPWICYRDQLDRCSSTLRPICETKQAALSSLKSSRKDSDVYFMTIRKVLYKKENIYYLLRSSRGCHFY